ncbi:unnamed protein product [Strongylus vulgaris]|uniref:Uncharacterized protein n=1 Tax=Strongylus vulgaris TaxID=40348 RepID=A0A3P7KLN3_STRVU|nr:unnamed protein product [Strongylus vulgaris]
MLTTEKRSKISAIHAKRHDDPSQYIGTYVPPVPP